MEETWKGLFSGNVLTANIGMFANEMLRNFVKWSVC